MGWRLPGCITRRPHQGADGRERGEQQGNFDMIDNEVTGVCSHKRRAEASPRREVCHNVAECASKRDAAARG